MRDRIQLTGLPIRQPDFSPGLRCSPGRLMSPGDPAMNARTLIAGAAVALGLLGGLAAADDRSDPWSHHRGKVPFVVGYEKGMASVEDTGKPPMFFFPT